jgi:hypothetical protein
MVAPELIDVPQTRDIIQEFRGYNNNVRIADNEFHNMKNMTSDNYPVLSPRGKRGVVKNITNCKGLLSKDKLAYVSQNKLYYNDKAVLELDNSIIEDRQLISMGAYIIIFPDMKYYNTVDDEDKGDISGASQNFSAHTDYALTDENGNRINSNGLILDALLSPFEEDGRYVGDTFWAPYNHTGYGDLYASDIVIDPFIKEARFSGIPCGSWGMGFENTTITYETTVNITSGDYGKIGSSDILNVDATNRNITIRIQNIHRLEEELNYKYAGTDNRPLENNPATIKFGEITVKRTIYQTKLTIADTQTRTYPIVAKIYYDFDPEGGSPLLRAKPAEYVPIKVGDLRLKKHDDGSVVERCTSIYSDIDLKEGEDKWLETWKEDSCWEPVQTCVLIELDNVHPGQSAGDIGDKAQEIIDNGTSDTFVITAWKGNSEGIIWGDIPFIQTLEKKYSEDSLELVKNNVKKFSKTSILVNGCLDYVTSTSADVIMLSYRGARKEMDYLIECNNRLWGCRYGKNAKGDFVNEIYASALGSFKQWDKFDNTAEDSYVVSLGSDGKFTGAINYNGKPMFFKENCTHIIHGSYPASYSLVSETGMGLADGSHKSLSIASNTLYYKSEDGIYAYNGASYAKISDALGKTYHTDAIGCATSDKYYVSMVGEDEKRRLYVFDGTLNLWHVEDDINVSHMVRHKNDVYLFDDSKDTLYTVRSTPENAESGDIEWYCESGIIGFSTPDSKYISKIQLRLSLPLGSNVSFFIQYDSDEYWEFVGSLTGTSLRAFSIPIMPRKCDHFRIRIEGKGECKIFSISKVMEEGGDYR